MKKYTLLFLLLLIPFFSVKAEVKVKSFKCAYKISLIKMVDTTTIEETIKCVASFDHYVSDFSLICVPYIPAVSQSKYEA